MKPKKYYSPYKAKLRRQGMVKLVPAEKFIRKWMKQRNEIQNRIDADDLGVSRLTNEQLIVSQKAVRVLTDCINDLRDYCREATKENREQQKRERDEADNQRRIRHPVSE